MNLPHAQDAEIMNMLNTAYCQNLRKGSARGSGPQSKNLNWGCLTKHWSRPIMSSYPNSSATTQ